MWKESQAAREIRPMEARAAPASANQTASQMSRPAMERTAFTTIDNHEWRWGGRVEPGLPRRLGSRMWERCLEVIMY